jgi:hypothetical protein
MSVRFISCCDVVFLLLVFAVQIGNLDLSFNNEHLTVRSVDH